MNADLRELYQDVILDHNKRPRNFRALADADRKAEGYNPLCGDTVTVYLDARRRRACSDVAFQGHGCAISTASASVMTEALKGKTRAEAEALFQRFHDLVTGKAGDADPDAARQARRLRRRPRVPGPRQVRDPVLAHRARRAGRARGAGFDGMSRRVHRGDAEARRSLLAGDLRASASPRREESRPMPYEEVEICRDVEVVMIPQGVTTTLKAGTPAVITQSLGDSYTLQVPTFGGLYRLSGHGRRRHRQGAGARRRRARRRSRRAGHRGAGLQPAAQRLRPRDPGQHRRARAGLRPQRSSRSPTAAAASR